MVKEECLDSTMKETLVVVIGGYITCLNGEIDKLKKGLEKTEDDFIKESLEGAIKNMGSLVYFHEGLKREVEKIPECDRK